MTHGIIDDRGGYDHHGRACFCSTVFDYKHWDPKIKTTTSMKRGTYVSYGDFRVKGYQASCVHDGYRGPIRKTEAEVWRDLRLHKRTWRWRPKLRKYLCDAPKAKDQ